MIPTQWIKKVYDGPIPKAKAYLAAITALNNVSVTPGELDLLSYMAVRGTITTPPVREGFMQEYSISKHRLKNIISSLQKKGLLYKDEFRKIKLNKHLQLNFKEPHQAVIINLYISPPND